MGGCTLLIFCLNKLPTKHHFSVNCSLIQISYLYITNRNCTIFKFKVYYIFLYFHNTTFIILYFRKIYLMNILFIFLKGGLTAFFLCMILFMECNITCIHGFSFFLKSHFSLMLLKQPQSLMNHLKY